MMRRGRTPRAGRPSPAVFVPLLAGVLACAYAAKARAIEGEQEALAMAGRHATGEQMGPEHPLLRLGAGFAAGVFNLPNLALGPSLHVQLNLPGLFPIEGSATYYFDNSAELSLTEQGISLHPGVAPLLFPSDRSRIGLQLTQVSAAVCPFTRDLLPGRLSVCGGAFAGAYRARAESFVLRDDQQTQAMFGLEAYLRWFFPIVGPVGFTYSAGLLVPLTRDRFGYRDGNGSFRELFRAAPMGGRLDLILVVAVE